MKQKQKPEITALILMTVCFLISFIFSLIDSLIHPRTSGLFSTIGYAAALICLAIAWVQYFLKKKHKNNPK